MPPTRPLQGGQRALTAEEAASPHSYSGEMESALVAAAVVAILALSAAVGALAWLTIPTATERRLLRAGPLRQLVRWYRTALGRLWLFPIGWPHVVDLALGARGQQHASPGEVVWHEGRATLKRFESSRTQSEPIIVVHALVTKPWILDLTASRSLVAFLAARGFDVYLLDWGDPVGGEPPFGLDDYATVLRHAEAAAMQISGATRVHEVGYCLAGTLLLLASWRQPSPHIASAALIAPPVDFAVPGGFSQWFRHRSLRPVLFLDGGGTVPSTYVREAFHALRPQALQALRFRVARRGDPEYRDFYAAMARWAWTHRRLPGGVFFDVVDLFRTNPLVGDGSPLRGTSVPMFMAIAERDHIVPSGSSHALTTVPGLNIEVLNIASGHVSMVVGGSAQTALWPALAGFLQRQQPHNIDR